MPYALATGVLGEGLVRGEVILYLQVLKVDASVGHRREIPV